MSCDVLEMYQKRLMICQLCYCQSCVSHYVPRRLTTDIRQKGRVKLMVLYSCRVW